MRFFFFFFVKLGFLLLLFSSSQSKDQVRSPLSLSAHHAPTYLCIKRISPGNGISPPQDMHSPHSLMQFRFPSSSYECFLSSGGNWSTSRKPPQNPKENMQNKKTLSPESNPEPSLSEATMRTSAATTHNTHELWHQRCGLLTDPFASFSHQV